MIVKIHEIKGFFCQFGLFFSFHHQGFDFNPLTPDQICHSPYCQPYNSHNVSSENLVLDQLIIPKLIFFSILITYLFDIVLIL